jgi:hypothetical protein
MPKPIAYKTGTIQPPNTAKQNNVLVGVGPSNWGAGAANATFYNSLDSSYQYVIIKNSAVPAMWGTGDFTDSSLLTTINGLPDRVGQTRFTNVTTAVSWSVASGEYSILKSEEVYPAPVINGLVASFNPKSVNRWPNGNNSVSSSFGGARYPLNMLEMCCGRIVTTIVDISNDKPYVGSLSNYAFQFSGSEAYNWWGGGSNMGLEVGKTYTFSFWLKSLSSTTNNMYVNQQGGSGDSTSFTAVSPNGTFINPTTTWQRSSWTFTLNADKFYLFFGKANNGNFQPQVPVLVTEIQLEEGNTPTAFKNFIDFDLPTNGGLSTGSWSLNNMTGYQIWAWKGDNGGCYNFDGVDDFIRLSVTPPITTALTYTAWVKSYAFSSNNAVFHIRGTLFELNSSGLQYWSNVQAGSGGANYSFTTGSWNFIAVTQNDTAVAYYVNGNQISTGSLGSINMSFGSSNQNFLGSYTNSRYLNGQIGNAQIYNRALSAAEIENLYNADISTYLPTSSIVNQGLTVYYDFSNPNCYPGSGTTAYDLSGYGYNGTLTNGVSYDTTSGGALIFDGVDDYVVFGPEYYGPNIQTVCIWGIIDNGFADGLRALVANSVTGDNSLRLAGGSFYGSGSVYNLNGGNNNDYQFGNPNRLMINGTSSLQTVINGSGLPILQVPNGRTLYQNFYVGAIGNMNLSTLSHTFNGRAYKGKMFRVALYNRQLTNAELQQNFNAFKAQYGF